MLCPRLAIVSVAAGLAVATLLLALPWGQGSTPPGESARIGARFGLETPPVAARGELPPLPESLRGTHVIGHFELDAQGRFQPSRSALELFDYFFIASGEEPDAEIHARIEAEIAKRLPPEAAADALAFFEDFLAYREAGAKLHAAGLDDDDLETRLQRVRELRREVFGAGTAELLFAEEEQLAIISLQQQRVYQDPELSSAEKRARADALEAELPPRIREARERASLPLRLQRQEQAMRERGASEREVRALREQMVGTGAANRLEALEQRRKAWNQRLLAYRTERDFLLEDPEIAGEALEALRQQHFSSEELARVRALDRIDGVDKPSPPITPTP